MKRAKPMTAERLEAVKKIYFNSWGRLRDEALQSNPNLTAEDAFDVVASLSARLHLYPNHLKLNEDAFAQWAAAVLTATIFAHGMVRECETKVRQAIRVALLDCYGLGVRHRDDEVVVTEDEILSTTWAWALQNVDELRKVGTAKLTTRLAKRAKWEVRAWKSERIAFLKRHVAEETDPLVYCVNEKAAKATGEPRRYALGILENDWDHGSDSTETHQLSLLEVA